MAARPSRDPASAGPGPNSGRRAAVRTAALAALLLAASLIVAVTGPEPPGGEASPSAAPPRPGPGVEDPATSTPTKTPPPRRLAVRTTGDVTGSVTLAVVATRRPAPVRVRLHGAAASVTRRVMVWRRYGRLVTVHGLAPGAYRWVVTSPTAARVAGRVRVVSAPPDPVPRTPQPTTTPRATVSPIPSAVPTPAPSPAPTPQPPAPQPTPAPSPAPNPPTPTRGPVDPGTVPPTPIG